MNSLQQIVADKYALDDDARQYFAELYQMHSHCFPQATELQLTDVLISTMYLYLQLRRSFLQLKQMEDQRTIGDLTSLSSESGATSGQVSYKLMSKISNLVKINSELQNDAAASKRRADQATALLHSYYTYAEQLRRNCELLTRDNEALRLSSVISVEQNGADWDALSKRCADAEAALAAKSATLAEAAHLAGCDENMLCTRLPELAEAKPLRYALVDLENNYIRYEYVTANIKNSLQGILVELTQLQRKAAEFTAPEQLEAFRNRIAAMQDDVLAVKNDARAYVEQYMCLKHANVVRLREIDAYRYKIAKMQTAMDDLREVIENDVPLLNRIVSVQKTYLDASTQQFRRLQLHLCELELYLDLKAHETRISRQK